MLVLLDTTVLIDCLRGRPAVRHVRRLWDVGDTPATSAICIEEVSRGLRPGEADGAELLVAGLMVLPVTEDAAWQSGRWRRDFAARGVTLHQADCLIAATACGHDARLGTGNVSDFPMEGVDLVHWPVGE